MADTLRVLYVDDEPDLLDITRMFLEESGNFSVTTIDSAPAALDLLDKEQFDAIVSDYQMPGMNGIEFLTVVRKRFGSLPFILFTGKGREEVVIEAINRGADFYLQKGGDPGAQYAELSHKIRSATSHEKTEATLRENERKYRNLYQYAQVGLFETSLRDGTVIACNERYATLAGFVSPKDAIGKDIAHLYVNPDDRNTVIRILHEQGYIDDHIVLFQNHQTGSQFWAQFSARINLENDAAEGTIIDITEQKLVEENLRESEERFKALVETSPDMIWEIDPGGAFRYISPQIRTIMGYDPEMLVGRGVTEIIPETARPYVMGVIARHVSIKMPYFTVEVPALHKDGRDMVIEIRSSPFFGRNGDLVGLRGIAHDITERRRASELVQESENKFSSVFHGSPVALTLISASDGKFVDINGAFMRATGYVREEIIGVTSEDLGILADDKDRERLGSSLRDHHFIEDLEINCRIKTGEIRSCLFSSSIILIGGKPHILSTVRDITERKLNEVALRESEAKHRFLIEESSDPLFTFTSDGRYTYANQALAIAFGKPVEEIIGKKIWDFFPKVEADKRFAVLSQVFRTGVKNVVEGPVPVAGGDRYFLTTITPQKDMAEVVTSAICISKDITERKQAEEALKQSERSYRELFNTVRQAVYILDDEGKFIDVNEGAERMYGYAREEFVGKTPEFISAPGKNDFTAVMKQIGKAFAGEPQQFEFWGLRKNNEIFPKDVRLYKGTYFGRDVIIATGMDTTDRKNTEVAFQAMVTSMVGTTGMTSLWKIAENISSWLGAECVMVGEVQPDQQTVNVLAMLLDGKEVHDYTYTLKGTPCDDVAEKGFCLYPDNVISLFPESRDLVDLNIKGYIGTPLHNSDGHVIGILCALFRHPVSPAPGMREIMNIIAVKAAAEIEGMQRIAALQESEEKFREVFENANDAITVLGFTHDGLPSNFTIVNENACRITGYTREEMLSLSPKDLDDPEEWDKALDITQKIMDRGYLVFERTLVRKDGKKVPIEISTHVFRLNHQDMMHSIFRDITERRAAEDAIRLANQKLNLLSGITRHDINNQLTILVGYLSLLEKTQHDLIFDKYLGKVRTAAGRISALIQFTKDYEQLGLNTPVWQEIEKISKMAAVDLLPASINLIVNTGQYEVFADPMFMLVLYNLFENANRHGVHATEIAMNFIEEENKGRLIIEDNGIGVPLALKEKIFEKGFGSNTGFGLYLSREILPITGLSIVETGIEGKGARFEINLPPGTWRRGPG